MTSPSELVLQDRGFNAGNLGLLQDFDIGVEVTPADAEDGAQAALMKALEEANVAAVSDSCLRAVQKGGKNNSPVDADLCFAFQVLVVPHSFV